MKLMDANRDRVSFAKNSLSAEDIAAAITAAKQDDSTFVPLADVPDIVWKNLPSKVAGGRDTNSAPHGSTGPEHPTHFADIDEPSAGGGKTLREMCVEDDANISVEVWQKYYTDLGHTDSTSRGLLPFRVWQHFNVMVKAAEEQDVARFVAAAGTLAHYVGDACQPLHGSMNADGFKDQTVTITHHKRDTGEEYTTESKVGAGVHSAYESKMVDFFSAELLEGIAAVIREMPEKFDDIEDGKGAAKSTILLMDRAAERIPPVKLIQTYVDAGGKPNQTTYKALWKKWGKQTIATMADGARVLAFIWDAAWAAGNGDKIKADALDAIEFDTLFKLYTNKKFVPSLDLDHIKEEL